MGIIENVGLLSCLMLCFIKWGWLDLYQVYRKEWMPEAGCYLCLGFWLGIALNGLAVLLTQIMLDGFDAVEYLRMILNAFISAPFINVIVMYARGKTE
jgi:hypothetical protein